MAESSEMLRLRALLGFYNDDNVTVTGLSRSLGEEKYTISRLLSSLAEEGLVDRSNNRHPKLTEEGLEVAERNDDVISFPAESFSFYNLRPGFSPVLHGTLPIKITANVGTMYMPESIAFFSVFL